MYACKVTFPCDTLYPISNGEFYELYAYTGEYYNKFMYICIMIYFGSIIKIVITCVNTPKCCKTYNAKKSIIERKENLLGLFLFSDFNGFFMPAFMEMYIETISGWILKRGNDPYFGSIPHPEEEDCFALPPKMFPFLRT